MAYASSTAVGIAGEDAGVLLRLAESPRGDALDLPLVPSGVRKRTGYWA